jgi:hypothetical protein
MVFPSGSPVDLVPQTIALVKWGAWITGALIECFDPRHRLRHRKFLSSYDAQALTQRFHVMLTEAYHGSEIHSRQVAPRSY